MPWSTSDRKSRLPSDWRTRRKVVLDRCGGRCEYMRSSGKRCSNKATDVDHIVAGDDHSLENLQGLCSWHHRQKTQREAQAARSEIRATLKRPAEEPPGAIDPKEARPRPIPGM